MRRKVDMENLWISDETRNDLSLATTNHPVLKTEMSSQELLEWRDSSYRTLYSSSQYKGRLDDFIKKHSVWKESMDEWRQTLVESYGASLK